MSTALNTKCNLCRLGIIINLEKGLFQQQKTMEKKKLNIVQNIKLFPLFSIS